MTLAQLVATHERPFFACEIILPPATFRYLSLSQPAIFCGVVSGAILTRFVTIVARPWVAGKVAQALASVATGPSGSSGYVNFLLAA